MGSLYNCQGGDFKNGPPTGVGMDSSKGEQGSAAKEGNLLPGNQGQLLFYLGCSCSQQGLSGRFYQGSEYEVSHMQFRSKGKFF